MKSILSVLAGLLVLLHGVQAQTISAGQAQLSFGNVFENAPATQQITVSNPLSYPVQVKDIKFFPIYGQPAFSVNQSSFTLAPGANQTLTVAFSPRHNIFHNTEMVIETNSKGGHLSVDLQGQGKYSKTYYNRSENKAEQALKFVLDSIISNPYTTLGYNTARDHMFMTIDNKKVNGQGATVNTLECVYTGRIITGYSNRSAAQNMGFNTEHTWPQSLFNSADPMVSDLHHLFPTDADPNNSRGNNMFGIATTPYVNDHINAPSHLGANGRYEPRDVQKGATARAMMYFVINYPNYGVWFQPQEAIIRTWHNAFPPTAIDRKRNDDVQVYQKNRNPFVDYPQFIERISVLAGASSAAPDYSFYHPQIADFGTVATGSSYTFHYIFANYGNQNLDFSNLTLSNTSQLQFANGTGTNFTLAPGEAKTVQFTLSNLASADSLNETLTFNTNNPNQTWGMAKIYANKVSTPLGVKPEIAKPAFDIYPNPASTWLMVSAAKNGKSTVGAEVLIVNNLGQTVKRQILESDAELIEVAELEAGVYFIQIKSEGQVASRKFVKIP